MLFRSLARVKYLSVTQRVEARAGRLDVSFRYVASTPAAAEPRCGLHADVVLVVTARSALEDGEGALLRGRREFRDLVEQFPSQPGVPDCVLDCAKYIPTDEALGDVAHLFASDANRRYLMMANTFNNPRRGLANVFIYFVQTAPVHVLMAIVSKLRTHFKVRVGRILLKEGSAEARLKDKQKDRQRE